MVRLEDILDKVASYSPSADLEIIKRAYVFSAKAHDGQNRLSGEPYLCHPLEVALLLADWKMDASVVATGLLHDTVEDTHTTIERIEELFGGEVAVLVDGLTKLGRITFEKKEDREAENFRKMILAMAKDMRVVLIKLADRLHNMRTLDALGTQKQIKIARETLDIYAPLAHRLGMGWIKVELEDLAFKYLDPEKYSWLEALVLKEKGKREAFISKVQDIIKGKLKELEIEGEVTGRIKHLYSIYRKMAEQDVEFENIHDIIAFRIIVPHVRDCYAALGIMHSAWKPVPGRFKDYIAIPKSNGYKSLHTTVVGPDGERMEIQIRTEEMHRVAEYGVAAHWKYKEGDASMSKHDKSFSWLRQLLEWQRDLTDSFEFLETLKIDLFPEDVFVFTPKGDIKVFPAGATPVDFAYNIHTDVGHRCTGAKVNGKLVPLKQPLNNGDVVEIITSNQHKPNRDWLQFVVTSRAKARIRQWIKTEEREKSLEIGREMCEKIFKKYDIDFSKLLRSGEIERIAREEFKLGSVDNLLVNIGYGKIPVLQVLSTLLPSKKLAARDQKRSFTLRNVFQRFKGQPKRPKSGVLIKGVEDVLVRFAKCCNPLPGDDIVGFVTQGQGVSVHLSGCPNMIDVDKERRIDVEWEKDAKVSRPVKIEVICKDEKGLLAEMSNAIKNADANISSAEIRTTPDNRAVCTFEIGVRSIEHLKGIMRSIQKVKKVIKVERVRSDITVSDAKRFVGI